MANVPDELRDAAQKLKDGQKPRASVRELLSWFDAARRRYRVVAKIRAALDEVNLVTYPDFEGEWVDATIYFMDKSKFAPPKPATVDTPSDVAKPGIKDNGSVAKDELKLKIDQVDGPIAPSHRLGRLKAAHIKVVSVPPTASIEQAITIMLANDFSQLPIMQNEREMKGMISWKSIGSRLALKKKCEMVKDAMEPHRELSEDDSIFDAVSLIASHDCVLVRDKERRITGVITGYDIANQFHTLTEPFLLLADVETRVRKLLASRLKTADLQAAKDPADPTPRKIEGVDDLTFGEYVFLLQQPTAWEKMGLSIDRATFCKQLDEVREVRNDVMHFDPDGIDEEAQQSLRTFAAFMERLELLTAPC